MNTRTYMPSNYTTIPDSIRVCMPVSVAIVKCDVSWFVTTD